LFRYVGLPLIPLVYYLGYRRVEHAQLQLLRTMGSRLGILLRLWHFCISLIDREEAGDTEKNIPISQWMLEQVPPNLDSAFWYQLVTSLTSQTAHGSAPPPVCT
jgi:hypothetical protein